MQKELDHSDVKFLKNEIKQVVVTQILFLFAFSILYVFGYIVIDSIDVDNKRLLHILYPTFLTFIILISLWIRIKAPLIDLTSNVKHIDTGKIEDLETNTNYGWSSVPGADFATQPILKEYYIVVNHKKLFIEESDFKKAKINDSVAIHYSYKTSKILQIDLSKDV